MTPNPNIARHPRSTGENLPAPPAVSSFRHRPLILSRSGSRVNNDPTEESYPPTEREARAKFLDFERNWRNPRWIGKWMVVFVYVRPSSALSPLSTLRRGSLTVGPCVEWEQLRKMRARENFTRSEQGVRGASGPCIFASPTPRNKLTLVPHFRSG